MSKTATAINTGEVAAVPCFHCGEPCTDSPRITVDRGADVFPVCCHGCRAVSELIFDAGLSRYYRFRDGEARRADENLADLRLAWERCDERTSLWGAPLDAGRFDLLLQTEGVHCAACAWLIRSRLEPLDGIDRVQVDIGTGYTRIVWHPTGIRLSDIALELARLGYRPHLPLAEEEERGRLKERRDAMLRVGVAGLGMMQVMMYAVGLYAGEAMGITAGAERFLEWTSLLVTVPVVFYAGRPFFTAALKSLRVARPGMDVPVALAIGVAFLASTVNFLRGTGAVYFDSVVMFIFFLSIARYVQLVQRHRNLQSGAALARLLPEWAQRIEAGQLETVLLEELEPGDQVRVRVGEPFPADGVVLTGETSVDESLLTGESRWQGRGPGDRVVGGSINRSEPVEVEVTAVGQAATVSALGRLLLKAREEGSEAAGLSEKIAGYFVVAVLFIAVLTGAWWWSHDASRALPAVLSVLVVSCPCALSLATPVAFASASRRLLRAGILLTRADALDALAIVNIALFDKTGTLTEGKPSVARITLNHERADAETFSEEQVLQWAAALEDHSAHALARAFSHVTVAQAASEVRQHPHRGLSGVIDGRDLRLGSAAFVEVDRRSGGGVSLGSIWLADDLGWLARFDLADKLRAGAANSISELVRQGLGAEILSGDETSAVAAVAESVGVENWAGELTPEAKMERVHCLQASGNTVLMVGDGVNDAPVLATADVSVTVQGATELANSAADLILTGESLNALLFARRLSQATRRIVRQNVTWALVYNAAALPLAIAGWLSPWMAALGMSASSLLVVANAARLSRVSAGTSRLAFETGAPSRP